VKRSKKKREELKGHGNVVREAKDMQDLQRK